MNFVTFSDGPKEKDSDGEEETDKKKEEKPRKEQTVATTEENCTGEQYIDFYTSKTKWMNSTAPIAG